ncbi:MAG: hypothetical protein QOC93_406 [Actinomycetota bacterium]|jgi:hypothetical protein|nr:hypothetical protein [Actinomycetota bacterium]
MRWRWRWRWRRRRRHAVAEAMGRTRVGPGSSRPLRPVVTVSRTAGPPDRRTAHGCGWSGRDAGRDSSGGRGGRTVATPVRPSARAVRGSARPSSPGWTGRPREWRGTGAPRVWLGRSRWVCSASAGVARGPRATGSEAVPARARVSRDGPGGPAREGRGAVPDSTRASRAWPGRTRVTGSDRDPGRAGPSGPAACGSTATLPVAGMPPSRRSCPRRAVNGPSQCVDTPRSPSSIRVNLTAIEGRRCTSRASLSGGHRWLHHRHPRSTCIPS